MLFPTLARSVPAYKVSGRVVAPAANAVIADLGAMTGGTYSLLLSAGASELSAVGRGIVFEHRNAGNTATLYYLAQQVPTWSTNFIWEQQVIAANERIRAVAGSAAGSASSVYIAFLCAWRV